MRLLLQHPDIASRSCDDCCRYVYLDKGPGQFGEVLKRNGKPVKRQRGMKPPCQWCEKIPEGDEPTPSNAAVLTPRNWQAYHHYLECKAVGSFPADAIVRRNAAIIRRCEDSAERVYAARSGLVTLGMMFNGKGA